MNPSLLCLCRLDDFATSLLYDLFAIDRSFLPVDLSIPFKLLSSRSCVAKQDGVSERFKLQWLSTNTKFIFKDPGA